MTLAEYLASPQAREDVKALLQAPDLVPVHERASRSRRRILLPPPRYIWEARWNRQDGPWTNACLSTWDPESGDEQQLARAYYRPDGDRYIVTDLGEGVRALRLRTGDVTQPAFEPRGCWQYGDILGADKVTGADLPDAICRVMLASLRVAGVGR